MSSTILAAVATLLAAALIPIVPPGEAPDEPAHFAYVAYLRRHERLPPVDSPGPLSYEFYQPPIAYVAAALLTAAAGAVPPPSTFESNPGFDFEPFERAFLESWNPQTAPIASIRAANLIWMPVLVLSVVALCHRVSDSHHVALTAAIPFAISPQVLFVHATFGNDAAVMALAAAATATIVAAAAARSPRPWQAALGGGLAGLALWAKASAALFLPVIAVSAIVLCRRKRALDAALLLAAYTAAAVGYIVFELSRSGSLLPALPGVWYGSDSFLRLAREPQWVASTWVSFWAKFGWFNVLLPLPLYLWFLAPTVAVARGGLTAVRRAREAWLLLVIGASNLCLLVFYLLKVDWQPQGRYLFPSLAALAGLAAIGVSPLCRAHPRATLTVSAVASLAVACASIGWIDLVYRQ